MKYKVGDKVKTTKLCDYLGTVLFPIGTIGTVTRISEKERLPYEICVRGEVVTFWYAEDALERYEEKNYEQGLADAWELAKKIGAPIDFGGISNAELYKVFGTHCVSDVFGKMTYEEALTKIEVYEKGKEIKVGDEVIHEVDGFRTKFFVTYLNENQIKGFDKTGDTHYYTMPNRYIKKTGRHINVEGFLKQIEE